MKECDSGQIRSRHVSLPGKSLAAQHGKHGRTAGNTRKTFRVGHGNKDEQPEGTEYFYKTCGKLPLVRKRSQWTDGQLFWRQDSLHALSDCPDVEIDQEANRAAAQSQVVNDLGNVNVRQLRYSFYFDNYFFIYDKIRPKQTPK